MSKYVLADGFINKLCEAFGIDPRTCRRIIVEAEAGGLPVAYVELFGMDRSFTFEPTEVRRAEVSAA